MAAILSAVDVVEGVLDAVNDDGAIPPTARRLASRLHVAPATLYSAIPAMGRAYEDARTRTIENALGAIVDAFGRGKSGRLVEVLLDRPNEGLFMTDPGVVLGLNPMISRSLERAGIDRVALGDLLALVGSLFTTREMPDADSVETRANTLVSWYRASFGQLEARSQATALPKPDSQAILSLISDGPRVDPGQPSRTGPDAEAARSASAAIVIRSDGSTWSFRELSRITGIPVTRLHRYGSRSDHLARAAADLVDASKRWADAHGSAAIDPVATAVQTGLANVLTELYRSSRAATSGPTAIRFDQVLCDVLSPSAIAVMTARQTSGDDLGTVVDATCLVAEGLAA